MSAAKMKQVIESIKELSADERALVAHCLISSLEIVHDDNVEKAWLSLAEKRFSELESGAVKGVSWETLKKDIKS